MPWSKESDAAGGSCTMPWSKESDADGCATCAEGAGCATCAEGAGGCTDTDAGVYSPPSLSVSLASKTSSPVLICSTIAVLWLQNEEQVSELEQHNGFVQYNDCDGNHNSGD